MKSIVTSLKLSRKRVGKEHDPSQGFIRPFISKPLIHGAATALLGIFVSVVLNSIMYFWSAGNSWYLFIPLAWTFVIAAVASIAWNLVYRAHHA